MGELRLPETSGYKCWHWRCRAYGRFLFTEQVLRDRDPLHPKCPACFSYVEREDWFAWEPSYGGLSGAWAPPTPLPTFVSFASEDARYRDFFIQHPDRPTCPYEVRDHSAHGAFDDQWKRWMLRRIRRSAVTVMLIGQNTYRAEGAIWEVETSLAEGIPVFGIRIHGDRQAFRPRCLLPQHIIEWTWDGIARMFAMAYEYHARKQGKGVAFGGW